MKEVKDRQRRLQNIIIFIIFVVSFLILFWRSFIGFQWNDEAFYSESAYRFLQGDYFFQHEWNTTQLSAVLIMPFIAGYRFIVGSNEGIILFCRMAYLVLSGMISIAVYSTLYVRKGKWPSLAVSLMYLFYAKQSIATLSYNTLAMSFLVLTLLIIYKGTMEQRVSLPLGIVAGIFYSLSVIANPFLAGLVIFYGALCLGMLAVHKGTRLQRQLTLGIILGILCSLVCFLLIFHEQNVIGQLWENLSNMVMSTDVDRRSLFRKIGSMFFTVMRLYKYTIIPYLLILLYLGWKWIRGVRLKEKAQYLIVLMESVILVINLISGLQDRLFCGVSFIALGMYGMAMIGISQQWYKRELFVWFLPGFLSVALFFMASNTGEVAIAAGCFFVAVGTVFVIAEYVQGKGVHWKRYGQLCTTVMVLTILSVLYARVFYVFRQPAISHLTEKIELGPCKGIYVTKEGEEEYTALYHTVVEYTNKTDTVVISKLAPWAYLATEARCGAYTTWQVNGNSEFLDEYYLENPDKIPSVVILINGDYGYNNQGNPADGYLFENIITEEAYDRIENSSAVIYRKK